VSPAPLPGGGRCSTYSTAQRETTTKEGPSPVANRLGPSLHALMHRWRLRANSFSSHSSRSTVRRQPRAGERRAPDGEVAACYRIPPPSSIAAASACRGSGGQRGLRRPLPPTGAPSAIEHKGKGKWSSVAEISRQKLGDAEAANPCLNLRVETVSSDRPRPRAMVGTADLLPPRSDPPHHQRFEVLVGAPCAGVKQEAGMDLGPYSSLPTSFPYACLVRSSSRRGAGQRRRGQGRSGAGRPSAAGGIEARGVAWSEVGRDRVRCWDAWAPRGCRRSAIPPDPAGFGVAWEERDFTVRSPGHRCRWSKALICNLILALGFPS
jgi:hypothetical protein